MKPTLQQAPIHNPSTIAASVYSHSGEFAPRHVDLRLPGRGIDLAVIRSYRSSFAGQARELGRGWSCSLLQKIEGRDGDILFDDGTGNLHLFARRASGACVSPPGFYGTAVEDADGVLIQQRWGRTLRFEPAERGGRLLRIEDASQNAVRFSYTTERLLVVDTLEREMALSFEEGLLRQVADHAGRLWVYTYDRDHCLVDVRQPATADFPQGTSLKYEYDKAHRLVSSTDATGARYLVTRYDDAGRVSGQDHGSGTFEMTYEAVSHAAHEFPVYRTTCRGKSARRLVVEHNELGNALSSTLYVRKESLAEKNRIAGRVDVPLVTTSAYNRNGELTGRRWPTGNRTEWLYSERERDPKSQGNLLSATHVPRLGVDSGQATLVTTYEYDPRLQRVTLVVDPRGGKTSFRYDGQGNLTETVYPAVSIQAVGGAAPRAAPIDRIHACRCDYNTRGQLIRRAEIDGSVTEFHYYPISDPGGAHGLQGATGAADALCGYRARIVRDAEGTRITTEYAYDLFGNVSTVWDGKGNAAQVRYNAMGKIERVTGRPPSSHAISYTYDANYNAVASEQPLDRFEYDEADGTTTVRLGTLRERREYDALNQLTSRSIVGGDAEVTEHFVRDADGRIVRHVQPMGNTTEYIYDERHHVIERRSAAGTRQTISERFTFTLNGRLESYADGNGHSTVHHYDGFDRYTGFTDPVGTTRRRWHDAAGNVVRETSTSRGSSDRAPDSDTTYRYDQWNRAYRVDRSWLDADLGKPAGPSAWDGADGLASSVLEFGENGRPAGIWTETGNLIGVEYDGAGRIARIADATGESCAFEYDENDNTTVMQFRGPEVDGGRASRTIRRGHDGSDRLVSQQENDGATEHFSYNAVGELVSHQVPSGLEVRHTHDALGRRTGHALTITSPAGGPGPQAVVRRLEYDGNYRPSVSTDAAGRRTTYGYDACDRPIAVTYSDGGMVRTTYDAGGNIAGVTDQNRNEVTNYYDAADRLVERRRRVFGPGAAAVERYEYDGLGRMVAATAPGATIRRTFDTLSFMVTEQQNGRVVRFGHDSAGNVTTLAYPGGDELRTSYDIQRRVTAVTNHAGEIVVGLTYRASDQIADMRLGETLAATCAYDAQERLESIEYRATGGGAVLERFAYQYDAGGRMTHEIRSSAGTASGERYLYDDAGRAVRAQYGVQDVLDPHSRFDRQTSYEHFPEGSWRRRIDADGDGRTLLDQAGALNQRNRYETFGSMSFEYDAAGNCVRRSSSNPGVCTYAYDQDNRLKKVARVDAQGLPTQAIEYFYDALGRQIRKVVTDQNGVATDYGYVWAGNVLIEEYENGVLVRAYFYGNGSMPVQVLVTKDGRIPYTYVFNGKGLASGVAQSRDPNAFAEKYTYEVTGAAFMNEIAGVAVAIPSRHATQSSLMNSVLSGNGLESQMRDWQNGSWSSIGGRHMNSSIAAALNSVTGGAGRSTTLDDFGKQLTAPPSDFQRMVSTVTSFVKEVASGPVVKEIGNPANAAPPPDPDPPVAPQPAGPDPDPDPTVMINPDADPGWGGVLSPRQIEVAFLKNKRPVNPNDDGIGSPAGISAPSGGNVGFTDPARPELAQDHPTPSYSGGGTSPHTGQWG